jgi:hypothetical protein
MDIKTTGLEPSRFQRLGFGQSCTLTEVEQAPALLDAAKVQQGAMHYVPLGFYLYLKDNFDPESEPASQSDCQRLILTRYGKLSWTRCWTLKPT